MVPWENRCCYRPCQKGVHIQWADGEVGEDDTLMPSPIDALTQKDLPHDEWAWKNKPVPAEMLDLNQERIVWFTFNFDAIIHQKAKAELNRIMTAYTGRIAFIGDETHYLKSARADARRRRFWSQPDVHCASS